MARVVCGGTNEFNMASSGEPHPSTLQYLHNQVSMLGNYVGNAASTWMDKVRNSFDQFNSSAVLRVARSALEKVGSFLQGDNIRELNSIQQFQQAPVKMQRFIMAEPGLRKMYHDQRVDGYSGSYVDMEPNSIGLEHYDFRRVMQGLIIDIPATEEDPIPSWKYTTYIDDLKEGDRELYLTEQVDILTSWDRVRTLMGSGLDDPTSGSGGLL